MYHLTRTVLKEPAGALLLAANVLGLLLIAWLLAIA